MHKLKIKLLVCYVCFIATLSLAYATKPNKLITEVLHDLVLDQNVEIQHTETDISFARKEVEKNPALDSFYIIDLKKIVENYDLWTKNLPNVTPHYAVKCNDDKIIIKLLALLGTNFDCASIEEIKLVLSLSVKPSRIIFAHPRKSPAEISYAYRLGITKMTFDSIEELNKMITLAPNTDFILRIKGNDKHSYSPLSNKFGASIKTAQTILKHAFDNNIKILGISFHIGDPSTTAEPYLRTLKSVAKLYSFAKKEYGIDMTLLDLGGGFSGINKHNFKNIASSVRDFINHNFSNKTTIIAEPGRFFVDSVVTSFMKVLGKEKHIDDKTQKITLSYFMSDGAYGTYHSAFYYHHDPQKTQKKFDFKPLNTKNSSLYKSFLWGATCDSGDIITNDILLPELDSGDYLYAQNVGAYTMSTSSTFNGIAKPKKYYIYR